MTDLLAAAARPDSSENPAGQPARHPTRRSHRHRPRRRDWRLWQVGAAVLGAAVSCALLFAAVVVLPRLTEVDPMICAADPLQAKTVAGLASFSSWLRREDASGFIGEVGWPVRDDAEQWNQLGDTWYRAADAIGLPVTAWSAGRWPPSYRMAIYHPGTGSSTLGTAAPQAAVIEAHPSTSRYPRGVVLAAGSFGAGDASGTYSNLNPGSLGRDYSYETGDSDAYLAGRGVRLVRLAVAWERLQAQPFGPLVDDEVSRVRAAIEQAAVANLQVILDLHSYGEYSLGDPGGGVRNLQLGSPDLPTTALADFWSRMSAATAGLHGLVGYGLMNEPSRLAAKGRDAALIWEKASQQSVDAIRRQGSGLVLLVSGYAQMAPADWGHLHPHAWIHDRLDRVAYEAHDYFDNDNSGRYTAGYADELARASVKPMPLCQRVTPLVKHPLVPRRFPS